MRRSDARAVTSHRPNLELNVIAGGGGDYQARPEGQDNPSDSGGGKQHPLASDAAGLGGWTFPVTRSKMCNI
jgi:hypothetical protein